MQLRDETPLLYPEMMSIFEYKFNLMKNFLVLTDFSFSSFNAARYAAMLAGTFETSRVILYHSFATVPVTTGELFPDPLYVDACGEESMNRLRDLEVALQPFLQSGTRIACRTDKFPLLYAAEEIARNEHVDLVVVGSKGHSAGARLLFGSNAINLITQLPFPLLVVPPDAIYEPVQLAVFSCELKDVKSMPIDSIRSIVRDLRCKLCILNVDPHTQEHADIDQILQQEKLHELMDELKPEYHYTNNPDIEEGIMQFAKDYQAGLVIVIYKKHGFFHNLFQASTAKKLVMHTTIPLLVLKEESK